MGTNKKKRKIGRNLLFLKTYLYFTILVILMAAIISVIFLNTYRPDRKSVV